MKYFDAHSHVSFSDFDVDRSDVLARMAEKEVGTLTVGVDIESSKKAIEFSEGKDGFYATIGLHPNDTPGEEFLVTRYVPLVANPKVVAIGECGLDYYRLDPGVDPVVEKLRKVGEFEEHMEFAI